MSSIRNIVVIGGGPAGTAAALAARKQDPGARIVLVTDEACEPYEKPPLSKAVLLGRVTAADAPIAGPQGVAAHDITLERSASCTSIDRTMREVHLADGRRLPYDALVIATGAVVRQLPALPQGMPGVHYLRTVADAEALKAALAPNRHLLVVGGGLIGLEVAASAAEMQLQVTVLEVAPRVLSRVCYGGIGTLVHEAHARHGVDVRVSALIRSTERLPGGEFEVSLETGEVLRADAIVVGTGARPDDRLATAAGVATNDGIVIDAQCRTSDPAIFAAGDVARFPGPDGPVRLENWRHALDQGTVAGRNAAGATEVYAAVPSFWSEQYDLYIQAVGWPQDVEPTITRPMPANSALAFEVRDGRVIYALGINAQRDLAAVRRLIERRVAVDPAALADPAQSLTALLKRA